jgi:hypothetical protein
VPGPFQTLTGVVEENRTEVDKGGEIADKKLRRP